MNTEQPESTQPVRDEPVELGKAQPDPAADTTDSDTGAAKQSRSGFAEGVAEFGGWVLAFVVGVFSS